MTEGGGIQHFQIKLKFWHYTTNKFDLEAYRHKHMKLFINTVMKRIYVFNNAAWNYRNKIVFWFAKKKISPAFKRTGSAERALMPVLLRITH